MEQKKKNQPTNEEIPNIHWADHVAEELLAKHPGRDRFVCASGISPSGFVHIGNFREVITVAFVVRALEQRGKNVRFIYSWDDYDAFRKVPENLPDREAWQKHLRLPISKVPDPFGTDPSYAAHFEHLFEKSLSEVEIAPDFLRQNECYQRGDYVEGVLQAIQSTPKIVEILNRFRTEPLPANWSPLTIYCSERHRDTTKIKSLTLPRIQYFCATCKADRETQLGPTGGGVKLLWRVDWPMRWAREGVDFEPGGKDHSSQGGSYETGASIVREVYGKEPPHYLQYDFVIAKGIGGKLSSSKSGPGELITLSKALEIYEPSVLRWIFASRKPNLDFAIAFDLDVLKAYDDFDRTVRIALGQEEAEPKRQGYERRIYELARTSEYPTVEEPSARELGAFPFRHLCNLLQIHEGNLDKTQAYFQSSLKNPSDEKRYRRRAECAWHWITHYAPSEFRFTVATSVDKKTQYPEAVKSLIQLLRELPPATSEETLAGATFEIMKANKIEAKAFFAEIYGILIGKSSGPKLASFLLALGAKRSADLLEKAL